MKGAEDENICQTTAWGYAISPLKVREGGDTASKSGTRPSRQLDQWLDMQDSLCSPQDMIVGLILHPVEATYKLIEREPWAQGREGGGVGLQNIKDDKYVLKEWKERSHTKTDRLIAAISSI